MKKGFKFYAVAWLIALVVFNVICFITPSEMDGMSKFGGAFWAGYGFITAAFVGQLVCAFIAFKAENAEKLFYNVPLISISYGGLVVMLIVGGAVMAVPDLPNWAGIVICLLVLAFTATSVIKAKAAATFAVETGEKVKANTSRIKALTAEAESLASYAKSAEAKAACKNVSEALRYSDPVSSAELEEIEGEIGEKFKAFAAMIKSGGSDDVAEKGAELEALIAERGKLCKTGK